MPVLSLSKRPATKMLAGMARSYTSASELHQTGER